MLNIVGLGPGDAGSITVETFSLLRETKVILRTSIHPTVEFLDDWGIEYTSLDEYYESNDDFETVYEKIARRVADEARECEGDLTYAVPGNPMIAEKTVVRLREILKEEGIPYTVYSAVSFIDTILTSLGKDPINGLQILDAEDIRDKGISSGEDVIITQVYNKRTASDVKISLSQFMNEESQIIFIRSAGVRGNEEIRRIPLYELDRQEDVDHLTSVFVEKESLGRGFNDFKKTIDALREPGGCPWDREQTHESLKRYMIEEAYEAVNAVDNDDMDNLCEELGDVLLQVVLNSRIAEEMGYFNIWDVIRNVDEKMIRRHPHVFAGLDLKDSQAVLVNWEKLKKEEKGANELKDKLKEIPKSMPALLRARETRRKAASYGHAVRSEEEIKEEIRKLIEQENPGKDELKSLLYDISHLAEVRGEDPELLLNTKVDEEIAKLSLK